MLTTFIVKYVISLDWFQVYCHTGNTLIPDIGCMFQGVNANEHSTLNTYEVAETKQHSNIYQYNAAVKLHGYAIAFLSWGPRTPVMNPKSVSLKIANRCLYKSNWCFYLFDIVKALDLEIMSVTRADVCLDFQRFENGMTPNEFIGRYVGSETSQSANMIVRKRSNKFSTVARKVPVYEGKGKEKHIIDYHTSYDYCRWGTRDSGVCTYLYNKTQELKDKDSKPWISDTWQTCGIIEDTTLPVYRLEMSISSKGFKVARYQRLGDAAQIPVPDIELLSANDFDSQAKVERLFWAYASHYFAFVENTGQNYVKDMPEYELLEPGHEPTLKPRQLNKSFNTGVSERRAFSCIIKDLREMPDMPTHIAEQLQSAARRLSEIWSMKECACVGGTPWEGVEALLERFLCPLAEASAGENIERDHLKCENTWKGLKLQAKGTELQKQRMQKLVSRYRYNFIKRTNTPDEGDESWIRLASRQAELRAQQENSTGPTATCWENYSRYCFEYLAIV